MLFSFFSRTTENKNRGFQFFILSLLTFFSLLFSSVTLCFSRCRRHRRTEWARKWTKSSVLDARGSWQCTQSGTHTHTHNKNEEILENRLLFSSSIHFQLVFSVSPSSSHRHRLTLLILDEMQIYSIVIRSSYFKCDLKHENQTQINNCNNQRHHSPYIRTACARFFFITDFFFFPRKREQTRACTRYLHLWQCDAGEKWQTATMTVTATSMKRWKRKKEKIVIQKIAFYSCLEFFAVSI